MVVVVVVVVVDGVMMIGIMGIMGSIGSIGRIGNIGAIGSSGSSGFTIGFARGIVVLSVVVVFASWTHPGRASIVGCICLFDRCFLKYSGKLVAKR